MERQRVLEILYEGVKDKTRILTGKTVCSVQSSSSHATITTTDGDQVKCDFLVGADGIRSLVRREIEGALPQLHQTPDSTSRILPTCCRPTICMISLLVLTTAADFATKYGCVYGISNALPQINPGRAFTIHQSGASVLIFSGAGGTMYWFLFVDLHETIGFDAAKRKYTDDDLQAAYALVADATVTPGVKFSDVFGAKRVAVMTGLEEGVADVWCWDRMLLLGDSAHKVKQQQHHHLQSDVR